MIIGPIGAIIGRYLSPIGVRLWSEMNCSRCITAGTYFSQRIFNNPVYQCGLEYLSRRKSDRSTTVREFGATSAYLLFTRAPRFFRATLRLLSHYAQLIPAATRQEITGGSIRNSKLLSFLFSFFFPSFLLFFLPSLLLLSASPNTIDYLFSGYLYKMFGNFANIAAAK